MTSGNNGASTPEDDDPFGYLYADGQANGAQPPSGGGYGYPNSVSRVRAVGERQYGQQQTAQYGQPPTMPQQQGAYGQPNAHYAAPENFGGGGPSTGRQPAQNGGGRGRGPNTKGLLIGAVAVVAAVVIGIAVAMANGDDGSDDNKASDQPTTSASASTSPSPSESAGDDENKTEIPPVDAKALNLGGSAALASDVEGAQAAGGVYVGNLNQVGNSVTWTVNGIPSDGAYTLFAHYSVPGEDQAMTLTVNGKTFGSKFPLKNYAKGPAGDFVKGWTTSFTYPTLTKGTNTLTLSCQDGDKCNVLLDQLWVKPGQVKS
ncbi:carbohydrate-binding protein [Streptomyces sp. NBC_00015]|uniref:carbohydrate-binding protein n=1 Tax=unclassified Streptomyces TaxID=2593676 RepID=UPI002259D855|nr:carbohydrate-binding protein [Streptomyces sp. NBC_00103]MCX5372987.1 carbohydrate-binding protein [Streptomyces sp. NBC_00103]